MYLWWEPMDADDYLVCRIHREEVVSFAKAVADPDVPFAGISHRSPWKSWHAAANDGHWLPEHIRRLEDRYRVPIAATSDEDA